MRTAQDDSRLILDQDPDLRGQIERALGRLPPYQVGKHGQLQEWLEDWDAPPTVFGLSNDRVVDSVPPPSPSPASAPPHPLRRPALKRTTAARAVRFMRFPG